MQQRPLGNTGLRLPVLSFGASSLGHEFGPVALDEALASVRFALDQGITHFDTSPYYGRGISEVVLGIALRGIPRERFTVGTKLGRYGPDRFDFSARRVAESVETSLVRLGVERLDMVFVHDPEFVELSQIADETLPALRRQQEQGKVGLVGVAGYPLRTLDWITDRAPVDVVISYAQYTLQNRRLLEALPRLESKGIGVLNAAPFALRLLTHLGPPDWHPAPPAIRQACAEAAAYCTGRGVDLAKLALQFAVRQRDITTIAGTAEREHIRKWVKWLEEPYDEALIGEVERIIRPVLNEGWRVGRAENN
jgi:aryl-alcohol dehydrogenase-like predicted oxidoreductase